MGRHNRRQQFLVRLLGATGLTALMVATTACGDDDGTTTTTTGGGGTGNSSSGGNGGSGGSTGGSGGDGGSAGGAGGAGGDGGSAGGAGGEGGGAGGGGGGSNTQTECYPDPTPENVCPDLTEAALTWPCDADSIDSITSWVSGPVPDNGMCCYEVTVQENGCAVIGRPFSTPEGALVSAATGALGWRDEGCSPDVESLSADARAALAEAWCRDALFEHASVASFGRFAMELMAVGAPADLVAAAHEAALDEVRHAKLGFALASAYAGHDLAPGAFPFGGSVEVDTDLARVAARTAAEGCIGETLAALLAEEQREQATDPRVRAVLDEIAKDEARHAALAWRAVAWAIRQGGAEVHKAVADVFADPIAHLPHVAPADRALAAHGRLDAESIVETMRGGLRDVVLPAARALLASAESEMRASA